MTIQVSISIIGIQLLITTRIGQIDDSTHPVMLKQGLLARRMKNAIGSELKCISIRFGDFFCTAALAENKLSTVCTGIFEAQRVVVLIGNIINQDYFTRLRAEHGQVVVIQAFQCTQCAGAGFE